MVGRTAFVLADPLAPAEMHGALIDAFVAEKGDVTFWQVSHEIAALLDERGFAVNALGVESTVDLAGSIFRPARRSFRTATNRLERTGHRVVEAPVGDFDPAGSGRFRRAGGGHARPAATKWASWCARSSSPTSRACGILHCRCARHPVAFAFFDPV